MPGGRIVGVIHRQIGLYFGGKGVIKHLLKAPLPLADEHHVGIAPVLERTRQESPEGEEETGENYGATS